MSKGHFLIEIFPNWHPLIVHFPVALLITAAGLFVAAIVMKNRPLGSSLYRAACYNLWLGTIAAAVAVATGWQAHETVMHDEAGHAAIEIHMRWAFVTLAVSLLASLASAYSYRNKKSSKLLALGLVFLSAITVAITGYLGGENVFRHGIGVIGMHDMHEHHHMGDTDHHDMDND
jgi:uncharacterized membrane protein